VGGKDEFGVDFSGKKGRALAQHYQRTLSILGLRHRSPDRTDIVSYRWIIQPLESGAIDAVFVSHGRRVIEGLLKGPLA